MQKTIKVLYIAGSGRSGSTILGQLLGEIDGFVNLGEVRYLFNERIQKRNLPCSCGATSEMCEFWAQYINNIPREVCLWSTKRLRLLSLPNLILGSQLTGQANLKEFLNVVEKLYCEMARDTGARVFIDTSKHPAFAWAMSQVPGVDVYILHLVRDARDVIGSWSRRKDYLRARFPFRTMVEWIAYNIFTEVLFAKSEKYMRLRYEDFVLNPLQRLQDVVLFVNEDTKRCTSLLSESEHRFRLTRTQHLLAGNPVKMQVFGFIDVQPRKANLNIFWQVVAALFCGPLLFKYGYCKR